MFSPLLVTEDEFGAIALDFDMRCSLQVEEDAFGPSLVVRCIGGLLHKVERMLIAGTSSPG
jgi:hypothetical protein